MAVGEKQLGTFSGAVGPPEEAGFGRFLRLTLRGFTRVGVLTHPHQSFLHLCRVRVP